jgi:cytoskeleton protein RodZ
MTVGSQLQQARRERKLSLADVTATTKIQPWVLEALESDRLQGMMSPIYVKGFLTTYAKFLRLEPGPLVAQLPWPEPEPVQEQLPPASPPAIQLPWPLLRRLGVAVAVTAVIAGLVVVNPLRWMPRISLPSLRSPKLAKAPASQPARPVAPPASRRTSVTPVSEPVKPPAPPALKLASITPVSEPVKPPTPPTVTLLATQPLELLVTAHRTTWIKVRADGKLLTQQRLQRGAKERWTAKKTLELIISKPSQVELTLNGQSISPFAIAHQGRVLITHHGVTKLPSED